MLDPEAILGTGIAVWASKDALNRLLGPSADYIGEEAKGLVEKANVNLSNIFNKAALKLGPKLDDSGAVNPRVLKQVWDEGRFVEDELTAEYFGGVLAAARSKDGRDERGLALISTVRDLSVFDLRLHYLLYTLVRRHFVGRPYSIQSSKDRQKCGLYIPFNDYLKAIGAVNEGLGMELLSHSLIILAKQQLIDHRFTMGDAQVLRTFCPNVCEPGLVAIPSFFGAELYMWAHGQSGVRVDQFLADTIDFVFDVEMDIGTGAIGIAGAQARAKDTT